MSSYLFSKLEQVALVVEKEQASCVGQRKVDVRFFATARNFLTGGHILESFYRAVNSPTRLTESSP